jgi:crossover junction endodeoxyribonuclease RuvC
MIVLGVDPGVTTTGYGVVAHSGGGAWSLLECGVVRTNGNGSLADRLRTIYEGITEILQRHTPDTVAVEGVFYGRNVRSTVILGHARAAVLLAAAMHDLSVAEYSPAEIKTAVVGNGRASKEQVQYMVQQLLRLRSVPRPADAADGVAVALCHCQAGLLARRLAAAASAR